MDKKQILYEDKDIIVCYKPAGIAVQTARVGQRDLVSEVSNYLAAAAADSRNNKPPFVGLVHRLDQPVEGILVLAKNQKAAGELSRQITANRMEKYYYAVVALNEEGVPREPSAVNEENVPYEENIINGANVPRELSAVNVTDAQRKAINRESANALNKVDEKTLIDYLYKDGKTNTSAVAAKEQNGAKRAELHYRIVERIPAANFCKAGNNGFAYSEDAAGASSLRDFEDMDIALAHIKLVTGRHHQIRVQMSHAGMSLLGDCKYADAKARKLSELLGQKQAALCAYELTFNHPTTGKRMSFHNKPEGQIFQNFSL